MTPLLNQLSLFESAQSFLDPDADPDRLAGDYYEKLFGSNGRDLVPFLPLFEIIPDWGNYHNINMSRRDYHQSMVDLGSLLHALQPQTMGDFTVHPSAEFHQRELLFYAELFGDLSSSSPEYDDLMKRYWNRIYQIYDLLPAHVDPRPQRATENLIRHFAEWV